MIFSTAKADYEVLVINLDKAQKTADPLKLFSVTENALNQWVIVPDGQNRQVGKNLLVTALAYDACAT